MKGRILAPIIRRDIAICEACLEMCNIAAQNHWSSFREPHEQRLVSQRVPGEQHDTSVAKDIVVAVDGIAHPIKAKENSSRTVDTKVWAIPSSNCFIPSPVA